MLRKNLSISKINLHRSKVTIIEVYTVNEDALVKDKKEYLEQLSFEFSKIRATKYLLVIGDINARAGKKVIGEK